MSDTAIHAPPPMPKPAVGAWFADPVFGSRLMRISDSANIPGSGGTTRPEYSTISAWSLENTWLLLLHLDHFSLWTGAGQGQFVRDLPAISASAQPRWSRKHDDLFYFIEHNGLMLYDVGLKFKELVHIFTEYTAITGKGESDIAQDRDAFVLAGVKPDGSVEAFVYDVESGTKYPAARIPGAGFDSLYIFPSAEYFTVTLGDGIYLFSRNGGGSMGRIATSGSHMDICRVDGTDFLVRVNSNDNPPLTGCDNGIEAVPLLNPSARRCLLSLPWDEAVHVSAADTGVALVESYQAPGSAWGPYSGEIVGIDLRTGAIMRLCHHRSAVANYECMPLTSVRRDGKAAVFGSNWGEAGGPVDTYLLEVQGTAVAVPPPAPTPVKHRPHGGGHPRGRAA